MVDGDEGTLDQMLDEDLDSDATTSDGLTNHLPMALLAKWRLGADADELRRFRSHYRPRCRQLPGPVRELDRSTWTSAIGQRRAAGDLRRYFSGEVAQRGVDETLRAHLPALLPGIGGGAFHGVIRLSYALDDSSPTRVAAGLAYLAEVGDPLGPVPERGSRSLGLMEIAAALVSSDLTVPTGSGPSIGEAMQLVARDTRFQDAVGSIQITDDTESELAELALILFATTGNFISLHGVTGMAAISRIRPWVDDLDALDRYSCQALAAAYVTVGAPGLWSRPRLDHFVGSNDANTEDVAAAGAASDDEHVAKLVYTAHCRWAELRDPLYLAAAAREVRTAR